MTRRIIGSLLLLIALAILAYGIGLAEFVLNFPIGVSHLDPMDPIVILWALIIVGLVAAGLVLLCRPAAKGVIAQRGE